MDKNIELAYQKSAKNIQELKVLKNGLEGNKMVQDYLRVIGKLEKAKKEHHECSKNWYFEHMKSCEHIFATEASTEEEIVRKVCIKCGFDTGVLDQESDHPVVLAIKEYHQDSIIRSPYIIYRVHQLEKIRNLYKQARPKHLKDDAMVLLLQELVDRKG